MGLGWKLGWRPRNLRGSRQTESMFSPGDGTSHSLQQWKSERATERRGNKQVLDTVAKLIGGGWLESRREYVAKRNGLRGNRPLINGSGAKSSDALNHGKQPWLVFVGARK